MNPELNTRSKIKEEINCKVELVKSKTKGTDVLEKNLLRQPIKSVPIVYKTCSIDVIVVIY